MASSAEYLKEWEAFLKDAWTRGRSVTTWRFTPGEEASMATAVSKLTEADVLEAAIEQLEQPDGYTNTSYFTAKGGLYILSRPSEDVGATCAIGAVEQAIWRLTSKVVTFQRNAVAFNGGAYGAKPERTAVTRLYRKTLDLLNEVALELPAAKEYSTSYDACPIEQLTLKRAKRTVLAAFREALRRARS